MEDGRLHSCNAGRSTFPGSRQPTPGPVAASLFSSYGQLAGRGLWHWACARLAIHHRTPARVRPTAASAARPDGRRLTDSPGATPGECRDVRCGRCEQAPMGFVVWFANTCREALSLYYTAKLSLNVAVSTMRGPDQVNREPLHTTTWKLGGFCWLGNGLSVWS